MTVRPYEYYDLVHMSISFEFDLNLYRIDRDAYNTLSWLGDCGGLKEALMLIGAGILSILQFQGYDNFMISKLYKSPPDKTSKASTSNSNQELKLTCLQPYRELV